MINEWSPKIAAKRLVGLINAIVEGSDGFDLYESGPCSKAQLLKDNWYKLEK